MASSSSPLLQAANETRNWLELPLDVTVTILHKLGAQEILESAQKVCTTWRSICKDPAMWRTIDLQVHGRKLQNRPYNFKKMAMHAIDRSCGGLVDISIAFCTEELLQYISERAGQLRRLQLVYSDSISAEGFSEATNKLPFLEELIIIFGNLRKGILENVGRSCPHLKSLAFNFNRYVTNDEAALAIAETMPGLCCLQLIGSKMSNTGLEAILNGCPHLESLDLRHCFYVDLGGDLGKLCSERIKDLRRPNDSLDVYGGF